VEDRARRGVNLATLKKLSVPSANGPRTAILYARVSGEDQAKKGYSLPDRRMTLREWTKR